MLYKACGAAELAWLTSAGIIFSLVIDTGILRTYRLRHQIEELIDDWYMGENGRISVEVKEDRCPGLATCPEAFGFERQDPLRPREENIRLRALDSALPVPASKNRRGGQLSKLMVEGGEEDLRASDRHPCACNPGMKAGKASVVVRFKTFIVKDLFPSGGSGFGRRRAAKCCPLVQGARWSPVQRASPTHHSPNQVHIRPRPVISLYAVFGNEHVQSELSCTSSACDYLGYKVASLTFLLAITQGRRSRSKGPYAMRKEKQGAMTSQDSHSCSDTAPVSVEDNCSTPDHDGSVCDDSGLTALWRLSPALHITTLALVAGRKQTLASAHPIKVHEVVQKGQPRAMSSSLRLCNSVYGVFSQCSTPYAAVLQAATLDHTFK
ncbi:hypothetical protein V8D89_007549 [Ganoderma adspersum]